MKYQVNNFRGLAPILTSVNLPDGSASKALNIRFDSGDMKPIEALVDYPNGGLVSPPGTHIGNIWNYRFRNVDKMISFGDDYVLTFARSSVPNDQFNRLYFCVEGEGLSSISMSDPDNPVPNGLPSGVGSGYRQFTGYRVGVPAPQGSISVSAALPLNRVGFDSSNPITGLSKTNPITVNCESDHDLEEGDRVTFRVNPLHPRPTGDVQEGEGVPGGSGTQASVDGQVWSLDGLKGTITQTSPTTFDVTGVSGVSFSDFTEDDLNALYIERDFPDSEKESVVYVFTYVTTFDEEGPPSKPSNLVDIVDGSLMTIDLTEIDHEDSHGGSRDRIKSIRIYRAIGGTLGASYLLVGTLPFAGGDSGTEGLSWLSPPTVSNSSLAFSGQVRDSVRTIDLSSSLESEGWFPPPNDAKGIVMMPNGIAVTWVDNVVYFSDPYVPHAYNPDNRITLIDEIKGIECFGSSLVVGTVGSPIIISGVDPSSMTDNRLELHASMLHGQQSITEAHGGVMYVSDNGLVRIGPSGYRVLTLPKYSKEEWIKRVRNLNKCVFFDRWVILYARGETPLFLSINGDTIEASDLSFSISAAARNNDSLAVVCVDSLLDFYRKMKKFAEGEEGLEGTWRSGSITFNKPVNFACARILAESYPVTLKIKYLDPSGYSLPVEGQPTGELASNTYEVDGPEPFRMVSGWTSRTIVLEVISNHRVSDVLLSTSMSELRNG